MLTAIPSGCPGHDGTKGGVSLSLVHGIAGEGALWYLVAPPRGGVARNYGARIERPEPAPA
jgi:hypothetical protein